MNSTFWILKNTSPEYFMCENMPRMVDKIGGYWALPQCCWISPYVGDLRTFIKDGECVKVVKGQIVEKYMAEIPLGDDEIIPLGWRAVDIDEKLILGDMYLDVDTGVFRFKNGAFEEKRTLYIRKQDRWILDIKIEGSGKFTIESVSHTFSRCQCYYIHKTISSREEAIKELNDIRLVGYGSHNFFDEFNGIITLVENGANDVSIKGDFIIEIQIREE